MTKVYGVGINEAEDHVTANFSPYDITVTADTIDNVCQLIRECIIGEGVERKDFEPKKVSDESGSAITCFIMIDMEREYKIRNTASVRKNITLPEWMDITLRELGVDASKLFQDAAIKYIAEAEKNCRITNVQELKEQVPKEILDEYILERVKGE